MEVRNERISNQRQPLLTVVQVVVDLGRVVVLKVGPHILIVEHVVDLTVS